MGFVNAFRALSREMRDRRGLKLYDITHHVQRSESAVSKWESGETEQPDHLDQFLDGYAEAFGITTSELVEAISQRMRDEEAGEAVEGEVPPPPDDPPTSGRRDETRQPSRKSTATSRPRPRGRRSRAR